MLSPMNTTDCPSPNIKPAILLFSLSMTLMLRRPPGAEYCPSYRSSSSPPPPPTGSSVGSAPFDLIEGPGRRERESIQGGNLRPGGDPTVGLMIDVLCIGNIQFDILARPITELPRPGA